LKKLTTNDEIETLCESMIKDYFKTKHYTNVQCVDIEAFVKEYLKVPIEYDSFREVDYGRVGFYSDGKRPLRVQREGGVEEKIYPERTIVIDRYLLRQSESSKRRFTIAHEGAHDILKKHIPLQTNPAAAFHSEFDPDMTYNKDIFKEMMSVNECFANRAAACLLMPRFLMELVLKHYNDSRKVIRYIGDDGTALRQDQKLLIQKMADAMGVSFTAFFNRLRELDLFEYHPMEEYLHNELQYGVMPNA
jgi:hypothetical protein